MTKDEVVTVAHIMMTADGECSVCAGKLLDQLVASFPQFKEEINEVWEKEYECKLDERQC